MLKCALFNPTKDKFQSLFENVKLGSFVQLDHQVDINLCLAEATYIFSIETIYGLGA